MFDRRKGIDHAPPWTTIFAASIVAVGLLTMGCLSIAAPAEPVEFTAEQQAKLDRELDARIESLTARLDKDPDNVRPRMQRGDALFHRGRFDDAVADYDRVAQLQPDSAHQLWQRGIALYYAGKYEGSARQFDSYHAFDQVDRENGIWRFLAQTRFEGLESARSKLIAYQQDDRPPFVDLYEVFAGKLTPEAFSARLDRETRQQDRDRVWFYADLYLGLYADAVGDRDLALRHVRRAVANPWGQKAQGGPGFMWHVARLHAKRLQH